MGEEERKAREQGEVWMSIFIRRMVREIEDPCSREHGGQGGGWVGTQACPDPPSEQGWASEEEWKTRFRWSHGGGAWMDLMHGSDEKMANKEEMR